MQPKGYLDLAFELVRFNKGKPKQIILRRAVSTAYYAMFHTLARCCADGLIGSSKTDRSSNAWLQVYRALEHGFAVAQCRNARLRDFPKDIQDFANLFATMQVKRHKADYNPFGRLAKSEVLSDLEQVKAAMLAFDNTSLKDKKAFSTFILFKTRPD
jgi:hypothetical protein